MRRDVAANLKDESFHWSKSISVFDFVTGIKSNTPPLRYVKGPQYESSGIICLVHARGNYYEADAELYEWKQA